MIVAAHGIVALVAAAAVIVGIGLSGGLALWGRSGGAAYVAFQAAVVAILIVSAVSGIVLLAAGHSPAEGLHFIYAAIALALIPLARSFFSQSQGRRLALLMLLAFLILGALVFRLDASG